MLRKRFRSQKFHRANLYTPALLAKKLHTFIYLAIAFGDNEGENNDTNEYACTRQLTHLQLSPQNSSLVLV